MNAEAKKPIQTSYVSSPLVAKKTDHINDVERQDDSGSANEDEIMYAIAS